MIESHTWWERKIVIPCKKHKGGGYELKEAIIYELSIEAFNRVAFLCSWVNSEDDEEILCSMTYSPQIILYFNSGSHLPVLKLTMSEQAWDELENKHTVSNVLWEANVLNIFNNINND